MSFFGLFWVFLGTLVYINSDRIVLWNTSSFIFHSKQEAISSAEKNEKKGIVLILTPKACGECGVSTTVLKELDSLGWTILVLREEDPDYETILSDDRFSEILPVIQGSKPAWGILNLGEELLLIKPGLPAKSDLNL
ncbi:hypothetical protein [Leptospira sarikeiensis]|uniref:Uncharacterized protein n=1 Tax=Leptospira sarikeiensis TaxID=2484943 RepID=A0A4V3JR79_9LEPT|nr:hypothetical protein [Leptospira sarikeiensis]TGL58955.1 hypothetical protein EHQ64_18125 [Leptospira sarikeiensis]